jgi:hypothetical protein
LRLGWIIKVQNYDNMADIAGVRAGEIGVAAIKGEPVHTLTAGLPEMDVFGFRGIGNVENIQSTAKAGLRLAHIADALVVGQHHAVRDPHLLRVHIIVSALHLFEDSRGLLILHVDNRGRLPAQRMTHIGDAVGDFDLAAAFAVHKRDFTDAFSLGHVMILT